MKVSSLILFVVAATARASVEDNEIDDNEAMLIRQKRELFDVANMWNGFKDLFTFETPQLLKDIAILNNEVPPIHLTVPYRFNKPNAKNDLKLHFPNSLISYCNQEKIFFKYCICRETYSEINTIENKGIDSVVVVAVNKKTKVVVVSYRPTVSFQNLMTTQDYPKVSINGAPYNVKVHQGFYKYYTSTIEKTQDAVESIINKPAYKNYPLIVTGYSLGAAIATISLPGWSRFLAKHKDTRRLEIFSYASPRVGNKALADYLGTFNIPILRYTNRNDLVNHLPPRSLGYVHVGAEYYERKLKNSKKTEIYKCSESWDEDPNCSYSAETPYSSIRHLYPFDKFMPLPPYCQA